jgi:hypothetical protein
LISKIEMLIVDQFPKSKESSIKVTLTHPQMKNSNKLEYLNYEKFTVKLFQINQDNNAEWLLSLKSKQSVTLPFEYFVEHPKDHSLSTLNF